MRKKWTEKITQTRKEETYLTIGWMIKVIISIDGKLKIIATIVITTSELWMSDTLNA